MSQNLLERIKGGDTKAFEEVYKTFYADLCNFSYAILHDHALVEETVDDVMFYLWDHRNEIDVTSLKSYLMRSVHNRSLNARNAKANRVMRNNTVPVEDIVDYVDSLFDDSHPLTLLLRDEQEKVIRSAISSLSDQCRTAFELSRYEHLTYAEIATKMGISVNTVKYHIKHAIQVLTERLRPYMVEALLLFLLCYDIG